MEVDGGQGGVILQAEHQVRPAFRLHCDCSQVSGGECKGPAVLLMCVVGGACDVLQQKRQKS